MQIDLNVASVSRKADEYHVAFKVTGYDAAHAVLDVLTHMQKDCRDGHGSEYIMDADGDGKATTYIDGDGDASLEDIIIGVNGGSPVDMDRSTFEADGLKALK